MQSVYSIGLQVHQLSNLKVTAEYREVSQILAEWAREHSAVGKLCFPCISRGSGIYNLRAGHQRLLSFCRTKAATLEQGMSFACLWTLPQCMRPADASTLCISASKLRPALPALQDVAKFADQACEALDVYDAYMGVFVNFPDSPWRRSALAFLMGMLNTLSRVTMECLKFRANVSTALLEEVACIGTSPQKKREYVNQDTIQMSS